MIPNRGELASGKIAFWHKSRGICRKPLTGVCDQNTSCRGAPLDPHFDTMSSGDILGYGLFFFLGYWVSKKAARIHPFIKFGLIAFAAYVLYERYEQGRLFSPTSGAFIVYACVFGAITHRTQFLGLVALMRLFFRLFTRPRPKRPRKDTRSQRRREEDTWDDHDYYQSEPKQRTQNKPPPKANTNSSQESNTSKNHSKHSNTNTTSWEQERAQWQQEKTRWQREKERHEREKQSWQSQKRRMEDELGKMNTSANRTPWEVLGISPNATKAEAKTAYRNLVKKYHPDFVQHLAPEFRELAEKRIKEINAAWARLGK